jgi:plastocyanin
MRGLRFVPVVLGVAVLAAAGAREALSAHAAVSPTMHAFVHEDATIGLTFDDGSAVGNQAGVPPTIPPGTYTIRAVDDALSHNFHLYGPGVDVMTTIGGTASPTWTVTFQPGGQYRFVCDDHADFMYGLFNTSGGAGGNNATSSTGSSSAGSSSTGSSSAGSSSGSSVSAAGKAAGSGSSALAGSLAGQVGTAGKLTLSSGGRAVAKLKAGKYKVTVADKASGRSFVLQRSGGAATTVSGIAFVGTRSVTLTLTAGKWTFYSSAGARSPSSFTVTS